MENVTISKDKNFVLMQIEGKAKPYKLDINTGILYMDCVVMQFKRYQENVIMP